MHSSGRIERVLVVTAHPDDVDYGAAGTIARWTACGIEVSYCIVTDGDAGGFDPSVPRSQIAAIRREEQTKAAAEVGVTDLVFLGHPDGRLEPTLDVRRDIARVIRHTRPDRVVCHAPERAWSSMYASHPDHLAAGAATMAAVYPDARNPFAFPELLESGFAPHVVPEVWVMFGPQPNRYSDITPTFDQKIAALAQHASQHVDPTQLDATVRAWDTGNAAAGGLPQGRLAEVFMAVPTA
jgi:LmbE family N-acetylglucosaminyl deacetylase